MISAPIPASCCRRTASSMPLLPPGSPTISCHHRVTNIHSCSRSPAWPNGASWLRPSPVPNPPSGTEKKWTRASDVAVFLSVWSSLVETVGRRARRPFHTLGDELDKGAQEKGVCAREPSLQPSSHPPPRR